MSLFISESRPLPPPPKSLPPKPIIPSKPKPKTPPTYKDTLNLTKWKIPNGF